MKVKNWQLPAEQEMIWYHEMDLPCFATKQLIFIKKILVGIVHFSRVINTVAGLKLWENYIGIRVLVGRLTTPMYDFWQVA